MSKYGTLGFYNEDGSVNEELLDQAITNEPAVPAEPKSTDSSQFVTPIDAFQSQALKDYYDHDREIGGKGRLKEAIERIDIDAIPEDDKGSSPMARSMMTEFVTSPRYLGWGAFAANSRGLFGEPIGTIKDKDQLRRLKDWACGNGDLMSPEQESYAKMTDEQKDAEWKVKGSSIWKEGEDVREIVALQDKWMSELPADQRRVYDRQKAEQEASAKGNYGVGALIQEQRKTQELGITEEELRVHNENLRKFYDQAVAQVAKKRREEYGKILASRNILQTLEANADGLSDRTRAFVAASVGSSTFDMDTFKSLPAREQAHALALVKIRRGELTEGYKFIPLIGKDGKPIDTLRVIYGVGRSVTDLPADVFRTLGDWDDWAKAESGDMRPSTPSDPYPLPLRLAKAGVVKAWRSIAGESEADRAAREKAYEDIALKHKINNAMMQEMPSADGWWGKTLSGFGDNIGFLLVSEVGTFAKLASARTAIRAMKSAKYTEAEGALGKLVGSIPNVAKDTRAAAKAFLDAKKGLPAAKAEYQAALKELELAKRSGVGQLEALGRVEKAAGDYARIGRAANPTVAMEEACSNAQFFQDLVKAHQRVEEYQKAIKGTQKAIEMGGRVAESALWYLPFYTRQLDRAAANGLPMEQSANRAFVTMLWSGWTEKQAMTAAARLGIGEIAMTRESWKTMGQIVMREFASKMNHSIVSKVANATGKAGKVFLERQVTNLMHGLDSAYNVTAQSVADEFGVMLGEIYDEAKQNLDRGYSIRKDENGNPVTDFKGRMITEKFTRDQFIQCFMPTEKWITTAMDVVREGAYPAMGFALLSGTNARFGHWRNRAMQNANLKAQIGAEAYKNYALKDGGLTQAYDDLARTGDAVFQFAMNDVVKAKRYEIETRQAAGDDAAKQKAELADGGKMLEEAGNRYSEILGRVSSALEKTGGIDGVSAVIEELGVDAPTAELLVSMARDYDALKVRDDFTAMFNNFASGKVIDGQGAWQDLGGLVGKALTVRNAEFAFRQWMRYAPNISEITDNGDGVISVDVDLGKGRSVTVGVAINAEITDALLNNSISAGGDVAALYEKRYGSDTWKALTEAEKKDFAAQVIEGNNRRGGGFFYIDSNGNRRMIPVQDLVTLTGKTTTRAVSHEISHSIYRAAEEMGYLDLDTKAALADALGIDRASEGAQELTNEKIGDRRKAKWELAVDEAVAEGYADYTNGKSAPSLPRLTTAFDSINNAANWVIDNVFGGADAQTIAFNTQHASKHGHELIADFYEAMMRGELEALKGIAEPFRDGEAPDVYGRKQEAHAALQAARKAYEQAADGKDKDEAKDRLRQAQDAMRKANAAWDKLRRDRAAGTDNGRFSLVTPEQAKEWMPETKVVDEDGNPITVYHGTVRDFTVFDKSFSNPEGDMGSGYYFSNSEADVDANYATPEGADLTNRIEAMAGMNEGTIHYIAFDPRQIKLADGTAFDDQGNPIPMENRGDLSNPDMRYSLADVVPADEMRIADSVNDAVEMVKADGVVGRELTNARLGMTANISNNSLDEMKNAKAVKKSVSPRLHALAVANVDKLFETAMLKMSHPDYHKNENVKVIDRLGSVMYDAVEDQYVPVMITVKEYIVDGDNNRIYTIESIDIAKYEKGDSAGQLVSVPQEQTTPIAESQKTAVKLVSTPEEYNATITEFVHSIANYAADINAEKDAIDSGDDYEGQFSLAPADYEPKRTYHSLTGQYLYKTMRVVDGHLEYPMAGTGVAVPVDRWLLAEDQSSINPKTGKRETKLCFGSKDINSKTGKPKNNSGTAAPFAGFHMGSLPYMAHIGLGGTVEQKHFQNGDYVWVKVDVPMDRTEEYRQATADYTNEDAMRGRIPEDGMYFRKTNPNMKGKWGVAGAMKIVEVLSDDQVDEILDRELPERVRMGRQGGGRFDPNTMTFVGQDYTKWNLAEEEAKFNRLVGENGEVRDVGNQAMANFTPTETKKNAEGDVTVETDGNRSKFSLATWEEGGRDILKDYLDKLVAKKELRDRDRKDMLAQMDTMHRAMTEMEKDFVQFGRWSRAIVGKREDGTPVMCVIKTNGDYTMNLDFSTLCKKRRAFDRVLREIIKRGNIDKMKLDEANFVEINRMIREAGFEVACELCFVDSKRYRGAGIAAEYSKMYNRLVNALIPEGGKVRVEKFNLGENPDAKRIKGALHTLPNDQVATRFAALDAEVEKMRREIIDSRWQEAEDKANASKQSKASYDKMLAAIPKKKRYDAAFAKTKLASGKYQEMYGGLSKLDLIAKNLKTDPSARRHLVREDLIDSTGFFNAYKGAQAIVDLYNNMGTAKPKETLPDVQFVGNEIVGSKSWTPDAAYAVGGVRVQSFSDFVPHMVFDYMQMFAELAAKRLPAHAYTKEKLFARLFGMTGLKINMSLVPYVDTRLGQRLLNKNGAVKQVGTKYAGMTVENGYDLGTIQYDADGNAILTPEQEKHLVYLWNEGGVNAEGILEQTRSFPFDEAMAIQSDARYAKNVGTIAVGVSDFHIRKMLNDPRIRMVIPYHKSSISPIVARFYNIDFYTDYTDFQSTTGTKAKQAPSFNDLLRKHKSAKKAADAYLKWCDANGCTPKFSQFRNEKNYYKLLEDFTCDVGGKYAEQREVRMDANAFPAEWIELCKQGFAEEDATEERLDQALSGGERDLADKIVRELGVKEAGRNSLTIPPELSRAFSTEDLLVMAAAGRFSRSTQGEESVRKDMANRLKALKPESTDADVDRLMQRAKADAKAVTDGFNNSADAEIMNRLTARQLEKYLSSLRRSGKKGIGTGVESERARQELDDRQAQKIAESIAAQTGISVNELEASLGVDLAETIVALDEIYTEAEKARGEETAEEEGDADPLPDLADEADDPIPLTPEEQAEREANIRALCIDIMHKAWEADEAWQKRKEERRRKAMLEKERNKNTEDETPDVDEGEADDLPHTAQDLADFIATKQAIDLRNPNQFAQFIAIMCEQKWKADHGLAENAYIWSDPVALQHLRMTAAGVYDSLARKLMYSNRRESAFNAIGDMEKSPTFGSLIGKMEFCGKVIAQGMVNERAQELIKDIEQLLKEGFGASGRFKQNEEDIHRKVSGYTELWAREVKKWLRIGDEKKANELQKCMEELAGAEVAFKLNNRDPNSSKEFNKNLLRMTVLQDFGGLIHRSLGEITDARAKIMERLENDTVGEQMQEREKRTRQVADLIEKAVETGRRFAYDDAHATKGQKFKKAVSNYLQEHLDFKHLLLDLARYCDDANARADYEEWVNNLQHDIQRNWDRAKTEQRREMIAFRNAIESIYGMPYVKIMPELLKHDERFDKFGEMIERSKIEDTDATVVDEMLAKKAGKKTAKEKIRKIAVQMSKAQAMNLYVAMQQKGYIDNVVKNDRQGQSAELRKLFTKEDLQIIDWLGKWYDQNRAAISEVSKRIFGLPVEAEEANYFPVTPLRPKQGLNEMTNDAWSPFPPALTARVRHGLDFDVRADIFSVWSERMQEQAQWKNFAELGIELRGIFGRQTLQSTVRHCHGELAMSNIKAFINDILNGGAQVNGRNAAVDNIRGWTALAALGGNIGVMLKQTTSIPAFAFEIGWADMAKYFGDSMWAITGGRVTGLSKETLQAMRDIFDSDQRKNRWDSGNSEEVANAFRMMDTKPNLLKEVMKKSMCFNKWGDIVPALMVGQGVYRSYLAKGLSKEEALNRTWEIINRTQQTGQMDNLTAFQRRSALGRFITQFQTTVRQYTAYEIAAIRNYAAQPNSENFKSLVSASLLNAVLASAYYWGGAMWQWILGRDPDEDTVKGWVQSVLTGCWSSLFFLGSFASIISENLTTGGSRATATPPAMAMAGNTIVQATKLLGMGLLNLGSACGWGDADYTIDDFIKEADRGLKAFFSPYRDASKFIHQRILGETKETKKNRLKRKSLKKNKPLKRR